MVRIVYGRKSLATERWHTGDLMPNHTGCLPPSRVDREVQGLKKSTVLSQVVLGCPTGLLQSAGGLSAAAMTRWWSSSGAVWARCPKKLSRSDLTQPDTGVHAVMLCTVLLVSNSWQIKYNYSHSPLLPWLINLALQSKTAKSKSRKTGETAACSTVG